MSLLAAMRARFRRWPDPADAGAVRALTSQQWTSIAQRTPTYLAAYVDRPGSPDRAQRRAEWLAGQGELWADATDVLELGCAAGRNLAALRRRWPLRVGGVDINAEALAEAARAVPGGQFAHADLYELAVTPLPIHPDVILTVGVLGHLEPTAVAPLLTWALTRARRVVLVEDVSADRVVVVKGPRPWHPEQVTSEGYVLYRHPLARWLVQAGAISVAVAGLPEDLRAPAATALLVASR